MKIILLYFLTLTAAIFFTSCANHQSKNIKEANIISDSIIKNVQTAFVVSENEESFIKLNGKVQTNETKQAKVFSLVSGKVQLASISLGDYVKKGQTLAMIKSTEVAGVSNDLSLAQSNVLMAKKNLQTVKDLYGGALATEQDYLSAKIAYTKAVSELNRSRQVASITGGIHSKYTIKAPISGFIVEKTITNNSEIRQDNNTALFTIADLSTVWVMADVYEADINSVHVSDPVNVNTLANPKKDYLGKIDKIYNVLDAATRTMKVRISLNNSENELKPEMFVTVKVNTKPSDKTLAIPSQAIVMDDGKNYVIVRSNNKLEVREISLIKRVDTKAYISGLSIGDEIVTNYQVFLYQALNTH